MVDLQKMAEKLARRTHHSLSDWRMALDRMVHEPFMNQTTDGEFLSLADAVRSPAQLHWLLGLFEEHFEFGGPELPFDVLSRYVNESGRSLSEWIESLEDVNRFAEMHQRPRSMHSMLGYISCCLSAPGLAEVPSLTLPDMVRDMLQNHGYQG